MASCEKCWHDAGRQTMFRPSLFQTDIYYELLEERKDDPCTSEQQCGCYIGACVRGHEAKADAVEEE